MIPVCSAGSNHVGAGVTWKAHVICDCAAAGAGTRGASETRARSRLGKGRQALMDLLLSGYVGEGLESTARSDYAIAIASLSDSTSRTSQGSSMGSETVGRGGSTPRCRK